MDQTKESLYQSIGQVISDSIADPWIIAWVSFETFKEGAYKMICEYETSADNSKKAFSGGFALYDVLLKLQQLMEEEGSERWKKAIIKLSNSGTFTFDFEY
jgi:hypothetical protein